MEVTVSSDVRVYARDFGPLRLVVVWRGGVSVVRWLHVRTGASLFVTRPGRA